MATIQKDGRIKIDHVALGEKLLKEGKSKLSSFFKKDSTIREGIETLLDAIHHFEQAELHDRLIPIWELIVSAYKAQFIDRRDACGTYHQLAKYCEEAGESLAEWEMDAARKYFDLATYYHKTDNDFSSAARVYKILAKIEETNGKYNNVIAAYNNASEAFMAAGSPANAAQCSVAKAEYLALKTDYKQAADEFVSVIKTNANPMESPSYCARALICIMVRCASQGNFSDAVEFDQYLHTICKTFQNANVYSPMKKILAAVQTVHLPNNTASSTVNNALLEFDRVHTLTPWTTKLLLKLKNYTSGTLVMDDNDFSESDDDELLPSKLNQKQELDDMLL